MCPEGNSFSAEILAIDDDTAMLNILRTTLEGAGFKVHVADNPRDGLKFFDEHWRDIDLVLLDYLMPEMTGDLVFESMQRINPDVRVVLLTAVEDSVARKMFAAGLRGYIQKPFYVDDLIQRVHEEIEAV
jgi:DNA-binding NtrC family response regulator